MKMKNCHLRKTKNENYQFYRRYRHHIAVFSIAPRENEFIKCMVKVAL